MAFTSVVTESCAAANGTDMYTLVYTTNHPGWIKLHSTDTAAGICQIQSNRTEMQFGGFEQRYGANETFAGNQYVEGELTEPGGTDLGQFIFILRHNSVALNTTGTGILCSMAWKAANVIEIRSLYRVIGGSSTDITPGGAGVSFALTTSDRLMVSAEGSDLKFYVNRVLQNTQSGVVTGTGLGVSDGGKAGFGFLGGSPHGKSKLWELGDVSSGGGGFAGKRKLLLGVG